MSLTFEDGLMLGFASSWMLFLSAVAMVEARRDAEARVRFDKAAERWFRGLK